jgi:hypothetical protein
MRWPSGSSRTFDGVEAVTTRPEDDDGAAVELEGTREAGGGACWCRYDSSAALSASPLLPRFNTFSPDDLGFLALICTVAVAVWVAEWP